MAAHCKMLKIQLTWNLVLFSTSVREDQSHFTRRQDCRREKKSWEKGQESHSLFDILLKIRKRRPYHPAGPPHTSPALAGFWPWAELPAWEMREGEAGRCILLLGPKYPSSDHGHAINATNRLGNFEVNSVICKLRVTMVPASWGSCED